MRFSSRPPPIGTMCNCDRQFFRAKYTENMTDHIVEAAHYNKRDDYYAISEIAVARVSS